MPNNYTPKNEWEKQYEREYRRIRQAIIRQIKLGYHVPEKLIPQKPSKVKNVTQEDVKKLIELTPKEIRKNSVYIDTETGEAFNGLDVVNSHHTAKPSRAKISKNNKKIKTHKKRGGQPTKNTAPPKENTLNMQIIDDVSAMLKEWQPAPYWHASFLQRKTENYYKISAIWSEVLETEGEYEVAYRLESNASEITKLIERLLYSSDSSVDDDFNMGRFIELLIGRPLSAFESDEYNEMARESAIESIRGRNSIG